MGKMIGKGAAGKVYRGLYKGILVAVKQTGEDISMSFDMNELKKEATIMSLLSHPNLIRCLGASTLNEETYYVMTELMPRSLYDFLMGPEDAPLMMRLEMAHGIARGMAYLHSLKLIHRDLKTHNVLLTSEMVPKIIDFGTTRVIDVASKMTTNLGTVQYMAPELFTESLYSEKADVYSFGIVLWEILTQETPYADKPSWSLPVAIAKGERPPMHKWFPQTLIKILKACLHSSQNKRPTFEEIRTDLSGVAESMNMPISPYHCVQWKRNDGLSSVLATSTRILEFSPTNNLSLPSYTTASGSSSGISGGSSSVSGGGTSTPGGSSSGSGGIQPQKNSANPPNPDTLPVFEQAFTSPLVLFNTSSIKQSFKIESYEDNRMTVEIKPDSGSILPNSSAALTIKVSINRFCNKSCRIPITIKGGKCCDALNDAQFVDIVVRCYGSVFGVDPSSLKHVDDSGHHVPECLSKLRTSFIRNNGLTSSASFSTPGADDEMKQIRELLCGPNPLFHPAAKFNPSSVASVIKEWFRSLPKGLLNSIPLSSLLSAHEHHKTAVNDGSKPLMEGTPFGNILANLPEEEKGLLLWLLDLFALTLTQTETSALQNFAITLSPNLYHHRPDDIASMRSVTPAITSFLSNLLQCRVMKVASDLSLDGVLVNMSSSSSSQLIRSDVIKSALADLEKTTEKEALDSLDREFSIVRQVIESDLSDEIVEVGKEDSQKGGEKEEDVEVEASLSSGIGLVVRNPLKLAKLKKCDQGSFAASFLTHWQKAPKSQEKAQSHDKQAPTPTKPGKLSSSASSVIVGKSEPPFVDSCVSFSDSRIEFNLFKNPKSITEKIQITNKSSSTIEYKIEKLPEDAGVTVQKLTGSLKSGASKSLEVTVSNKKKANRTIRVPVIFDMSNFPDVTPETKEQTMFFEVVVRSVAQSFGVEPSSMILVKEGDLLVPQVLVDLEMAFFRNKGIDSFSALSCGESDPAEVGKLRRSLDSGDFNPI